jgi:hypothetical protein
MDMDELRRLKYLEVVHKARALGCSVYLDVVDSKSVQHPKRLEYLHIKGSNAFDGDLFALAHMVGGRVKRYTAVSGLYREQVGPAMTLFLTDLDVVRRHQHPFGGFSRVPTLEV